MLLGRRRIAGTLEPRQSAKSLGLGARIGGIRLQRHRDCELLKYFQRMVLPRQQQSQRQPRLKLLGISRNRLLIVSNGGIGMVLGIVDISQIEPGSGVGSVGADPGQQQLLGTVVVLQRDIAFGLRDRRVRICLRGLR